MTVSQRTGMLKTYQLMNRHFGWDKPPAPASEREIDAYLLDRALRSQGIVSLQSVSHGNARRKQAIRRLIETRVGRKELVPVELEDAANSNTGRVQRHSMPFPMPPRRLSISYLPSIH